MSHRTFIMQPKVRGPHIHWGLISLIPEIGTLICSQNILQSALEAFHEHLETGCRGSFLTFSCKSRLATDAWVIKTGSSLPFLWCWFEFMLLYKPVKFFHIILKKNLSLHHFEIEMGILKSVASSPLIERDLAQISTWQNNTKLCTPYFWLYV